MSVRATTRSLRDWGDNRLPLESGELSCKGRGKVDRQELSDLKSMFYFDGSAWVGMPTWARFYLQLGAALSNAPHDGSRCVVAIDVPTRAFAAALVSSGIIVVRAGLQLGMRAKEHLSKLRL